MKADAVDALEAHGRPGDPAALLAEDRARTDPVSVMLDYARARLYPEDPRCIILRQGDQRLYLTPEQMTQVCVDGPACADDAANLLARLGDGS